MTLRPEGEIISYSPASNTATTIAPGRRIVSVGGRFVIERQNAIRKIKLQADE